VVRERVRRIGAGGFTLTELGVALALVALLAALATPALYSYRHAAALRAGARELAGAITHARQLAILLNAPVCVAVAGGSVKLERGSANACTGAPLPAAGPAAFPLASGLIVESAGPKVILTSLGAATPGGSYTVIHPVTGARLRVIVAASGRVSIQ
jgi:prepilin-type N-terminal cleavage/methylation domain-containing protein